MRGWLSAIWGWLANERVTVGHVARSVNKKRKECPSVIDVWEEVGGGRAGEMSGRYKRDGGEERRVRGGGVSETGGGRGLFPRPAPFAAGQENTFYSRELAPGFLSFSSPQVPFCPLSPLCFSFFSLVTSINCWEDVSSPRHVLESECLSHKKHLRV